jgi:tetratricopeptide (TPR) repeat protein
MLRDRGLLTHDDDRGWQLAATGELPLPETVQGMIAARLDTLAPEEKDLVQDAAVIGKVFWPGALAAIGALEQANLDRILHSLERKELVRREHRSAISGERQFAFLHILVRDVAYAQIPRARRVEKHRGAAEWIASLGTERSEDRAEMLAHHYLEALDLAGAAGIETDSFRDVACLALAEAGERALALNSALPALRFSERALELTSPEDPLTATLLVRCVRARWLVGEFGEALEEAGTRAVEAALDAGDKELAAEVTSILAQNAWIDARHDRAMELSARAVALTEDMPPSPTRARVRAQHARRSWLAGSIEDGEALARSALTEAEALDLDEVASHALNTIGMATITRDPEAGLEMLRRSISIAEGINNPFLITTGYNNLASMLWALGRLEEGVQTLRLAHAGNERFGSSAGLRWGDAEEVFVAWVFGRWEEAIQKSDAYVASEDPIPYQKAGVRMVRSDLLGGMGNVAGALEDSTLALETAREMKDPQVLVPALGVQAIALIQAGRSDEANVILDELVSFDFSQVTPTWLIGNGMAFRAVGRSSDYLACLGRVTLRSSPWVDAEVAVAEERLADAARIYEGIGARGEAARAWLAEGERLATAEGSPAAESALRRSLELSRSVGATGFIQRAESLLAASA